MIADLLRRPKEELFGRNIIAIKIKLVFAGITVYPTHIVAQCLFVVNTKKPTAQFFKEVRFFCFSTVLPTAPSRGRLYYQGPDGPQHYKE